MGDQSGSGSSKADWYADPMGRHQFRYWDGVAWTDSVTDDGKQTTDPVSQAPPSQTNKTKQRLIERAQPFLPPGTQIRQIFGGETRSPVLFIGLLFLAILPGAIIFMLINRNRIIAVTQDAIYVLSIGSFAWSKPKRVLRVLPRATRFGPASGTWPKINVGPERLWTSNRVGGSPKSTPPTPRLSSRALPRPASQCSAPTPRLPAPPSCAMAAGCCSVVSRDSRLSGTLSASTTKPATWSGQAKSGGSGCGSTPQTPSAPSVSSHKCA